AHASRLDAILEARHELRRSRLATDHPAQRADHAEDLRDAPLVEKMYLQSRARELRGDVRLQVGEAEDEIRLQGLDAIDLRAGERRDARLLLARARRPYREAGDPDDAMLFTKQIQRLGCLLGEADDALRKSIGCRGHECLW